MTWNQEAAIGTPIYAIDDAQQVVKGTLGAKRGGDVRLDTATGEQLWFHARFVCVDPWRRFEDLP